MNFPTFKEQFDKITEAYLRDEINPYDMDFCFCGTLAGRDRNSLGWKTNLYSGNELGRMEFELLDEIRNQTLGGYDIYFQIDNPKGSRKIVKSHPNYEQAVFDGMVRALNVLKSIHESKGEKVDSFEFVKREFAVTTKS